MMISFSPLSVDDCYLDPEQIDIWEFPLHEIPQAMTLLNEEEQRRAKRFYFPHHQYRFTTARAILRLILASYLQKQAKKLEFTYSMHGKPHVLNPLALQFNLSHSKNLALVAIGQQHPVGIDLEFFSSRPYDGLAKNLFSTQEKNEFSQLPPKLKPYAFFHVWAQKEAFIKACGMGLHYPTQQFNVPLFGENEALIQDTVHSFYWNIKPFMPKVACSAALCYQPKISKIRYLKLNTEIFFTERLA